MDSTRAAEITASLKDKVSRYEPGDLMTVAELSVGLTSLSEIFRPVEGLSEVGRLCALLSRLAERMGSEGLEDSVLPLLNEALTALDDLLQRRKSGPEAAAVLNETARKAARIDAVSPAVKSPAQETPAPSQDDKSVVAYSEDYFAGIVSDRRMLLLLVDEAREHLDKAQFTLVELEHDEGNAENINLVFRAFHTIKGSSAFLGLRNIEEVAHEVESMLVLVRDGRMRVTADLVNVIFFGIELLRELLGVMEANDCDPVKLPASFRRVDIFSYIRIIRRILAEYPHRKIGEILVDEGKLHPEQAAKILSRQVETGEKFGAIAVDEKLVTQNDVQEAIRRQKLPAAKRSTWVKVSNERLNSLVDAVGELVINQSMLQQAIRSRTGNGSEAEEKVIVQLEGITTNIKNLVLSMGMVPIAEVFNKLRVVARNTSQELGKTVSLDIRGEETELDRNVIEAIYDPLVHMTRNAIDHGLETPAERESLGKDRVGRLTIEARHKGNGIEIAVTDDGKGIHRDIVLAKAVETGLVTSEAAAAMSDRDVYSLLFLPGFSTAKEVTEVSGRGVGMDVVRKNVEEIRGRIEVESEEGSYTRFIIRLPLTLAIIDGFVVTAGVNRYVYPFQSIEEIVVPDASSIRMTADGGMMIHHRGAFIPVVFAGEVFMETSFVKEISKAILIILTFDNRSYAVAVDRVVGKQEIVVKSLGEVLAHLPYFSGGTIFGDGTIGFVVDIQSFLDSVKFSGGR
jgi:two-component system chemotaxis sensor kinase CheA